MWTAASVGRVLAMTHPSVSPSVITNTSAPRSIQVFAAQWLAYALPYRRFANTLAGANARLGADADRYSFTVEDFHLLLFAGFDRRTRSQEICTKADTISILGIRALLSGDKSASRL